MYGHYGDSGRGECSTIKEWKEGNSNLYKSLANDTV